MPSLKRLAEEWGIHSFLLPVFFVLHSYTQYFGLVSGRVAFTVLWETELIFLGFFLLLFLFIRQPGKSGLITTVTGIVALFYGVFKDFVGITLHASFLTRYLLLLPASLLLLALLTFLILRSKKDFRKITLFLNLLLLLLIAFDGQSLLRSGNAFSFQKNLLVAQNRLDTATAPMPANRPDVYYLLFDCYPGSAFLQNYMQYDNSGIDHFLQEKGFHIIPNSQSNYNRTSFSMAATFNFEYLQHIHTHDRITARQYNQAVLSMEHAVVPAFFVHCGYTVYNLSIFDLAGQPSLLKETFLTAPEKSVLLYNTIIERIKNDIGWNFTIGRFALNRSEMSKAQVQPAVREMNLAKKEYNHRIADSLAMIPRLPGTRPKFIYAHFYLPHPPFFYDKNGKSNDINEILQPHAFRSRELFLSYLQYTNGVMRSLVDSILNNSPRPPVIIIQGDHGFTDFPGCPSTPALFFKNYSAFYFPDKDYSTLYDTLSNINTFPLLFNKYFTTRIAMQPDSSILLGR